jgi:hypothetical protein
MMESFENKGFSLYRPGNLIRRNKAVVIAWPGDLCIPDNLAQVRPLHIDELVLKHLGFVDAENPVSGNRTYKRKVNWPQNFDEDKRQLEFFVLFKNEKILMGLKHPRDTEEPSEMIEVQFAHDLQNHYATLTGLDELNVLLVNAK